MSQHATNKLLKCGLCGKYFTTLWTGEELCECCLAAKVINLQVEVERLREYKADVDNSTRMAMDETCKGEKHCSCVPLLRLEIKRLRHDRDRLRAVLEGLSGLSSERGYECLDANCTAWIIAKKAIEGIEGQCTAALKSELDAVVKDYRELLESAFKEIASPCAENEFVCASPLIGWWDSNMRATACDYGDRLVALGLWEKHPDGMGSRQWYRKLENEP